MRRKAQITTFIIIGLLILLGAIIGYAVFKDVLEYKPPEEQVLSEVETELKPLAFAIQECQERLLEEGTRRALTHGGYIDPETSGLASVPGPGGSAAALGSTKVAYWHYLDDATAQTRKPALTDGPQSIAGQLAQYVDERIDTCVSWDEFNQYEIERQAPQSTVGFGREQTQITTHWPLTVQTQLGTKEYEQFRAEIPAPVAHLYRVHEQTTEQLRTNTIPEENLMRWTTLYAHGDGALPPLYEGTGFGNIGVWPLQAASEELRDVATRASNNLQLYGSQDALIQLHENEALNNLALDALLLIDEPVSQTQFSALTPSGEQPHLRVNDNPAVAISRVIEIPVVQWITGNLIDNQFVYDITTPIVLRAEKDGYVMHSAYEINIQDNQPAEYTRQEQEASESYCQQSNGAQITIRAQPREEASALYTCGENACALGTLRDGELTTTLPACADGELELLHDERYSERTSVTSSADQELDVTLQLHEPQAVKVEVMGYYIGNNGEEPRLLKNNPVSVPADVLFQRHGQPYVARTNDESVAQLVPGTYDVLITNIKEYPAGDPLVIPEETIEAGGQSVTLNATNLTSLPLVYADYNADKELELTHVPARLRIYAPALREAQITNYESLQLLGALFELESEIEPDETYSY